MANWKTPVLGFLLLLGFLRKKVGTIVYDDSSS